MQDEQVILMILLIAWWGFQVEVYWMISLSHFDLHFSNIMYDRYNYFIIDWANAKLGNPILDIARTYVVLRQYAFRLSDKYLKMISKELDIELISLTQAIKAMAVLRLIEMSDDGPKQRILDLIL